MRRIKSLDWFAYILVLMGALNWGLVGIFDYNAVHALFGEGSSLTTLTYVLVGFSAVYFLLTTSVFGSKK